MAEVDEYVENGGYTTVVCVMLEKFLARDDGLWAKKWFNFFVVVVEL